MTYKNMLIIFIIFIFVIIAYLLYQRANNFPIPSGGSILLKDTDQLSNTRGSETIQNSTINKNKTNSIEQSRQVSSREIFITGGVKHSIPIDEILSGGLPKDGIPSIDNPKFINANDADFLSDDSIGLGFVRNGVARFYPFSILVWHEIVNDIIVGDPILITYCPLCRTAVVFERKIDGKVVEFGVSGKLWQSNLLMYNRGSKDEESLWSQVLGEAVLGKFTGTKLKILPADTVRFSEWKKQYPKTEILSQDTGASRNYGSDPYGDYYTSDKTIFPTTFNDNRLGPKDIVIGIEVGNKTKAYLESAIIEGNTTDKFAGKTITITKNKTGEVRFFIEGNKTPLPAVWGFWFSWQAVHPDTELFK